MNFTSLLSFLEELKSHNTKEWFDQNRKNYESLKREWIAFADQLIPAMQLNDPDLLGLEGKSCIFRINRDIRFSKNKDPYKTNFGLAMSKTGDKKFFCGYYLHIEPGASFLAGGMYQPEPMHLEAIRQEIDYEWSTFQKLLKQPSFLAHFGALGGEKLSRPPKGYSSEHEAIEILKHKSFIMESKLPDSELKKKDLVQILSSAYGAMKPINDFLFQATKDIK